MQEDRVGHRGVQVGKDGYRGVQEDRVGYRGVQVGKDGYRGVATGAYGWMYQYFHLIE